MATLLPTLTATSTAQSYGDGTKPLFVTASHDFFYSFGVTEPTAWHRYSNVKNACLNVNTQYGKIWFFVPIGACQINISTGV